MPHFMVTKVPVGLLGLIIAAIMSAAMSTISSGMNASATVFSVDIYQKYIKSNLGQKESLRLLYIATTVFGLLGMLTGIAMIGVKSVLDVWWMLSGIFAGGWGAKRAAVYGVPEEELGEFYAQRTLLKREVLPENIANAAFVLCSADMSHTTGLHVPVDAGVAAAFLR